MKHQKSFSSAKNCDSPLSRLFLNYIKCRDGLHLHCLKTWQLPIFPQTSQRNSSSQNSGGGSAWPNSCERLVLLVRASNFSPSGKTYFLDLEKPCLRNGEAELSRVRWLFVCQEFFRENWMEWYLTPQKICPSHFPRAMSVVIWLHVAPIPSNFGTESPDMIYPRGDSLFKGASIKETYEAREKPTEVTVFMMVVSEWFISEKHTISWQFVEDYVVKPHVSPVYFQSSLPARLGNSWSVRVPTCSNNGPETEWHRQHSHGQTAILNHRQTIPHSTQRISRVLLFRPEPLGIFYVSSRESSCRSTITWINHRKKN